jgi:hypothetical protein
MDYAAIVGNNHPNIKKTLSCIKLYIYPFIKWPQQFKACLANYKTEL